MPTKMSNNEEMYNKYADKYDSTTSSTKSWVWMFWWEPIGIKPLCKSTLRSSTELDSRTKRKAAETIEI